MAEDKGHGSSIGTSNREDNNDDLRENAEYLPNVVRLEPDIGLGNRSQGDRKRRNNEENQRREEGPISFRHFLQNDAGPSSSYPDLYSCSRQERLTEGPVIDPESPDLPDFVQDHLAVEHMYFNNASQTSSINVPDFAPSMSRSSGSNIQWAAVNSHEGETRRSTRNRIPLDLPVPNFIPNDEPQSQPGPSLPFDLTTGASGVSCVSEIRSPAETELPNTGRLPDFLSDGHIVGLNSARSRDNRIEGSEDGNSSEVYNERHNLLIMLRQENNRLRDELNVLQSVLMKKDDRIKELEDLVMALEISKLQMSSDANTQTMNKSAPEDETAKLKRELEHSKNEVLKLQKEKINAFAALCQEASTSGDLKQMNANLAVKIKQMTNVSERLVRELLKIITDMRNDVSGSDQLSEMKNDSKASGNSDNDECSGPSTS